MIYRIMMGLNGNRLTSSFFACLLVFILLSLRGCSGFSIKSRTTKDSAQLVIEGNKYVFQSTHNKV